MFNQQIDTYDSIAKMNRTTSTLKLNQRVILNMRLGTIVTNIHGQVILGRDDQSKNSSDFVNLSKFGGLGAGVSRQHAYLVRDNEGQIFIGDKNSSNGTYLNEDMLRQNELYPLDNGDVIRLGKLLIHVLFE